MNYEKACRCCLSEVFKVKKLDNVTEVAGNNHEIRNMLNFCFDIQIKADDGYPQNICMFCLRQLQMSSTFKMTIANAFAILQRHSQNMKTNVVFHPAYSEPEMTETEYIEQIIKTEIDSVDNKSIENSPDEDCDFYVLYKPEALDEVSDIETINEIDESLPLQDITTFVGSFSEEFNNDNTLCKQATVKQEFMVNDCLDSAYYDGLLAEADLESCHILNEKTGLIEDTSVASVADEKPILEGIDYFCIRCDFMSFSALELSKHCSVKHARLTIPTGKTCDLCNEDFSDFTTLLLHRKKHFTPFICPVCWDGYKTKSELDSHSCKFNPSAQGAAFDIDTDTIEISKDQTIEIELKYTPHADENNASSMSDGNHSIKEKIIKTYTGKKRKKDFFKILPVPNDKNLLCTFCDAKFAETRELYRHCTDNHEPENAIGRPCDYCNAKFPDIESLLLHRKKHLTPFICPLCWKGYVLKLDLDVHICEPHVEIPKGINRFKYRGPICQCHLCGKSYNEKYLKIHMKIHGDRKYKCKFCSLRFHQPAGLILHMNVHSDQRHTCELCNMSFKTKKTLQLHIRNKHQNERKRICSECGKAFFSTNYLKKHMLSHSAVKTFQCSVCRKPYKSKTGLHQHLKSHKNS